MRLAVRASRPVAIAHAAGLWRAERWLHLDIEPSVNHLAAARPVFAETAGYYYGLAHFIVTPLVLAWLWLRRPAAFGPLRSALVLATTGANVVFWTWPVAPPRFAVPGMADVLVRYRILGAGGLHGPDSLVNLYAAMPSLHVAWAAWCAAAIVAATRGRWRHLAWLYPAATTVVVLATANHFLAAAAGLAITGLGLLAARARTRPDATEPGSGAGPGAGLVRPGPRHGNPPPTASGLVAADGPAMGVGFNRRQWSRNQRRWSVRGLVGGSLPDLLVCAVVALPPVPGEGDEATNHVGRQPRSARDVPQRRVLILGLPEVRRPHLGFPACEYPPARTWGPAEPVLDHAEGAGGNVLAVLELSQRPLGHPGRLGKGPPVPHA